MNTSRDDLLVFRDMGTANQLKREVAIGGLGRFVIECQQMPTDHDGRIRLKVQAVRYVGWRGNCCDLYQLLATSKVLITRFSLKWGCARWPLRPKVTAGAVAP